MQNLMKKSVLMPQLPACNLLSQLGGVSQLEEIIESTPEQDFEDLQLSQQGTSGPGEPIPIRRSERICL